MDTQEVMELYQKERDYQSNVFGQNSSFNVASFIIFAKRYLEKAEKSYVENWTSNLPDWLETCKEYQDQNTAPVETYGYLIKTMALIGQALELNSTIIPEEWRKEGVKEKWTKN